MKHLKSVFVLIISLSFGSMSMQAYGQKKEGPTAATKDQVKQLQDIIRQMDSINKAGKGNDDPDLKKLAKKAIVLADSFYNIHSDNIDGEPEFDPEYSDPGDDGYSTKEKGSKKIKVYLGRDAFKSPGWLGSTKYHEIGGHGAQAGDGRWPDKLTGKIIDILETDAYDGIKVFWCRSGNYLHIF